MWVVYSVDNTCSMTRFVNPCILLHLVRRTQTPQRCNHPLYLVRVLYHLSLITIICLTLFYKIIIIKSPSILESFLDPFRFGVSYSSWISLVPFPVRFVTVALLFCSLSGSLTVPGNRLTSDVFLSRLTHPLSEPLSGHHQRTRDLRVVQTTIQVIWEVIYECTVEEETSTEQRFWNSYHP